MTKSKEHISATIKPSGGGQGAEYTVTLAAPSYNELEEAVPRLACDIKDRREQERKQRVLNFFAGKKAGAK